MAAVPQAAPARHFPDWLQAFVDYASFGEAPTNVYFWVGVGALAGALRRKVWIDQVYFKWHANFYIVLVAPPGIISKTTTADTAMSILREVPGIRFGPDVVTWQALVKSFAESCELFELDGEWIPMSAITLVSGEFGNLLDPQDREMVDLLVALWDGRKTFEKVTKMSGSDMIQNPWINFIACTTPDWIASHFPESLIGGGFTSRCIFVYADEKARYVAYPARNVPKDILDIRGRLRADLEHIATNLCGPYALDPDALAWGEAWYREHYANRPPGLDDDRFGGYIARKQTHLHKVAMILAASHSDELVIKLEDMKTAYDMVTALELNMPLVFAKIGQTSVSMAAERFVNYIRRNGPVTVEAAQRHVRVYFPDGREFQGMFQGTLGAGLVKLNDEGKLIYVGPEEPRTRND